MMIEPSDPIAAVTHPNPYPWYAQLAVERPIYRDIERGLWVAASADAVTTVLTHPDCRVRPADEPVPVALAGTAAGDLFGRLVRMNDGERNRPLRQAVTATLATVDLEQVARLSQHWANRLAESGGDIASRLSTYVLGSLLGIPGEQLGLTADWLDDYIGCLAPSSTPQQVERGAQAAGHLHALLRSILTDGNNEGSLLHRLAVEAQATGVGDTDRVIANGIGFMTQAYEATAGLIANTLVTLANDTSLRDRLTSEPELIEPILLEVLRSDPSVQNTRRFIANDTTVAGQAMRGGDVILVVLAAANRDPAANPDPNRFDPDRDDRRSFTFGAGVHACPGSALALTIAQAAVERLLADGVEPVSPITYRPSANGRIPAIAWNRSQHL